MEIGGRDRAFAPTSGSFLDGGGSRPLQRAAVALLEPARVETGVDREPDGTFYVFAHLRDLPPPLDDGMELFRRALDAKVISVPGVFFDVNPGGRRSSFLCRFHQYVRLSFGPEIGQVAAGLDRLEGLIGRARAGG